MVFANLEVSSMLFCRHTGHRIVLGWHSGLGIACNMVEMRRYVGSEKSDI